MDPGVAVVGSARAEGLAFDKEAYERYKIARKLGEAISGWDRPEMLGVAEAAHMRPDDYVVGLVFRGRSLAYPLWVIDNYHVVNDEVDGVPFFVASCERCQSGSAFEAVVEGSPDREPLFRSVGFMNATLLLKDLRSGSHWIHYEGRGLDRRAAGRWLPWIPTYHMEWADWVDLHPDTTVMVPPEDPTHPDARHGHGREEIFARQGMDPGFIPTIVGDLDTSYPESEMVLGVGDDGAWAAFPLREVQREGGVVHHRVGPRSLVVLAGPRADGFTMAAFVPEAAGRALTFARVDGRFVDEETGSAWTIEGSAVAGPLAGASLHPVRSSYVRWHAWIYFHRDTELYRSRRDLPALATSGTGEEDLDGVLGALAAAGHEVRVAGPVVSQRRPLESAASVTAFVDGDRVNLHRFTSERAARDFHAFDASWSGLPIKPRSHEGMTWRAGPVVLESDPEVRFADPAQVVPLPHSVIRWASVLRSDALAGLASSRNGASTRAGRDIGFVEIVRGLRIAGFEVIDVGFLPPGQLRPGVVNGIALTIEAERFLLYRFVDPEAARSYSATEPHSFAAGAFVVRSTPDTMYHHQASEVLYVGEDGIRWSPLLDDPAFRKAVRGAIDGS